MQKHVSIRKYKDWPIEEDLLNEILNCVIRSATSGNMQFYSIIVTKDISLKKELHIAHGKQDMILQAPVVLTFCADLNRVQKWMKVDGSKTSFDNIIRLFRGFVDSTIVAQSVVCAAEASGLGICYMGSTLNNCDIVAKTLNIPDLVFPVTSLVMGWPDETPEIVSRLPT